ncbi:hypothetical protein [Aeromonas veronii]|uniref:hypothetical protein n=1 Tax=Aeromonas veronii TaxID=654 RepID=UPI0005AAF96A|nr:hypothetical protein [Aeromonas veronii]
MKSIFKKGINICIGIFILAIFFIGGAILYEIYNDAQLEKKELEFHADKEWKWQDDNQGIQITYDNERKQTLLRKVILNKNYEVIVAMMPNYNLEATAKFYTKCEPSKVINTEQKFPDGSIKTISCNKAGDAIRYRVIIERNITERYPTLIWKDNIGGFVVDIDLSFWNFDQLDREVTLDDSKPWEMPWVRTMLE